MCPSTHRAAREVSMKPKNTILCAPYTRKSIEDEDAKKDEQDQKNGHKKDPDKKHFGSLESQYTYCLSTIKAREYEGWELYPTIYEDNGFSGATLDRPAFQRLLADAKAGKFKVIVVYKIDRISRSLKDFVNLVEELDKYGIAIVSATQNFDTSTALGRFIMNILMSFAELERGMISDRVRDKVAAQARKGRRTCGIAILGYDIAKPEQ